MRIAVAVGAAASVLILFAPLAWIAGELRYRNCLAGVELRYPVAFEQPLPSTEHSFGESFPSYSGGGGGFVYAPKGKSFSRNEAISSCSRWP